MAQHPASRCGNCHNCKQVDSVRTRILRDSAPAGPGITDAHSDVWNTTLETYPCQRPLLLVTYGYNVVLGKEVFPSTDDPHEIRVNTVQFGEITVPRDKVKVWSPQDCLDGIDIEYVFAALKTMPSTFYPALIDSVVVGAVAARTFVDGGLTRLVARLENTYTIARNEGLIRDKSETAPGAEETPAAPQRDH